MTEIKKLLQASEQLNTFVKSLIKLDDSLFFSPIKEGKWTPAEIISHITYWDRYIVDELLPKMKQGAHIESVDFEVINKPASDYALSGVSKTELIKEQLESRKRLLQLLEEKTEEEFFASFTLNGEDIDEYSGYPHSLFSYISAFIWHDNHHKKQIEAYLEKEKVSLI